jgi:hypothetical protein
MQAWIVGLIVAYAFWTVSRRYMPKAVRRAVRAWAARTAQRFGWNGIAARLSAAKESGGSCGDGCGSCGGCGPKEPPSASDEHVIKWKVMK